MQTIHNTLSIIASVLTIFFSISGYQSRYQRVVLTDNQGKITKTIDFVSDIHIPRTQKASSSEIYHHLSTYESALFTPSERALLDTLRSIASEQHGQNIDIILEYSHEAKLKDLVSSIEALQKSDISDQEKPKYIKKLSTSCFLHYLGIILCKSQNHTDFHANVTPADTYRQRAGKLTGDFFHLLEQPENYLLLDPKAVNYLPMVIWHANTIKITTLLHFIQHMVDTPTFGQEDRMAITTQNLRHAYLCNKLWRTHIQKLAQEFNYFFPHGLNLEMILNTLITQLKQENTYIRFIEQLWLPAVVNTADLEMLFHILSSNRSQVIVIAGAFHCDNITHYLKTYFGFTELINVGSETKVHYPESTNTYDWFWYKAHITGCLQPEVWRYLKEKPEDSLENYKKHGKIEALVDTHFWKSVHEKTLTQDQIDHAQHAYINYQLADHTDHIA